MEMKFLYFLAITNSLESYICNCYESLEDIMEMLEDYPEGYLNCAFVWGLTPEGYDYWSVLNDMWKELLENE